MNAHIVEVKHIITKSTVSRHITTWVNFDGSEVDSSEMYSGLGTKPLKFVFCADCHEKIAKI